MMTASSSMGLGFGFASKEQVAIVGDRLIHGPAASAFGLREALRRHAPLAEIVELGAAEFERAVADLYRDAREDGADLTFELDGGDDRAVHERDLLEDSSDAPVIRLVNQLLRRAVQMEASDLHFEPHEQGLRVRVRIDGFLVPILERDDVPVSRVASRLKVMAGLDIAETRLPQDGRIALKVGGRAIDTRVSTLPGNFGERIVVRILDRKEGLLPLADLGISEDMVRLLERLSARPDGIILATGPTGSGKTTTLYSLLKLANRQERNLITVEDPVEYNVKGLNQTQINSDIGMTFSAGLRAALRQDPDVILVGEIRDGETASIAGQAALTGHLVFSSLHANTAVGAVVRLRDLGVEDYLISATLRGIIAQRLLRVLCADCKQAGEPTGEERARFAAAGVDLREIFTATGCPSCSGVGYRGRIGVYDIVEIDAEMRAAIDRAATETDLRALAEARGPTLYQEALAKVAAGVTDIAEMHRVLGTDQ
jgi:general secretion pathway protein E